MKANPQRKSHIAQEQGKHILGTSKVKKGTNRKKGSAKKASESEPFVETRKEVTPLELKSVEVVDPSTKIKLQLFPVDEVTRIGLEKEGFNPFLELTLRARKKISSVINHIHTKWGGSSIAIGEPMLSPYDPHLRNLSISSRWTSKDMIITAGDVYTAVKSPAIFRLSYGWFSDDESPRVSAPHHCITSESTQKQIETPEERKCLDATTEVDVGVKRSTSPWDDEMTNLSIGGLLSEASLQGKLNNNEQELNSQNTGHHHQEPIRWDDSLTALSIGGLLSEASLQAKINKNNNKFDSKSFISDSFDAIISSQVKNEPQVSSSILDAEETCHAFSFRKFSTSSKNIRVSARASQDLSSNSFKFPDLLEVEKQSVHADDSSCPETKPELFPRPQQYNEDSRSLGLRGINWNESFGPFDLGNSMHGRFNV